MISRPISKTWYISDLIYLVSMTVISWLTASALEESLYSSLTQSNSVTPFVALIAQSDLLMKSYWLNSPNSIITSCFDLSFRYLIVTAAATTLLYLNNVSGSIFYALVISLLMSLGSNLWSIARFSVKTNSPALKFTLIRLIPLCTSLLLSLLWLKCNSCVAQDAYGYIYLALLCFSVYASLIVLFSSLECGPSNYVLKIPSLFLLLRRSLNKFKPSEIIYSLSLNLLPAIMGSFVVILSSFMSLGDNTIAILGVSRLILALSATVFGTYTTNLFKSELNIQAKPQAHLIFNRRLKGIILVMIATVTSSTALYLIASQLNTRFPTINISSIGNSSSALKAYFSSDYPLPTALSIFIGGLSASNTILWNFTQIIYRKSSFISSALFATCIALGCVYVVLHPKPNLSVLLSAELCSQALFMMLVTVLISIQLRSERKMCYINSLILKSSDK